MPHISLLQERVPLVFALLVQYSGPGVEFHKYGLSPYILVSLLPGRELDNLFWALLASLDFRQPPLLRDNI